MRKNNKKRSSSLLTKTGVILVTILFIVAMALIFVTTALMISIAGRQRVYTNAIDSQARLTCLSLSQAIWQAIYSQQITDADLVSLAKGTAGNGSVVVFTNSDLPGMGLGDSECTAYFYCIGNPSKIGIECKCEIEGNAQYYRMVLERNRGEDMPPASFNTLVELGNGGDLNSCNFGVNVDFITNNERNQQVSFDAPDNVVFLHAPGQTQSTNDGLGVYSTLITDGQLAFGDIVFARDTYFLGPNAGYVFGLNGNQTNAAKYNTAGEEYSSHGGTPQYGDLYFWGTNSPFYRANVTSYSPPIAYTAAPLTDSSVTLYGVNNLYFDRADDGAGHITGFDASTFVQSITGQFFDDNSVTGDVYYENGISVNYSGMGANDPTFHNEGANYAPVGSSILGYRTPGNFVDTTGEVASDLLPNAEAQPHVDIDSDADLTGLVGGKTYYINDDIVVNGTINVNLGSGNIYVIVTENHSLMFGGNGYFNVYGGSEQSEFFIFLKSGATIKIGTIDGNNPSDGDCSGIVDRFVYRNSRNGSPIDYTNVRNYGDVHNLDQTKIPRCRILSTYLGGEQVIIYSNDDGVLTAMLGLYADTPGGAGGGSFKVRSPGSIVYYGRMACGGIDVPSGNTLNIPYCPAPSATPPGRATAYRDNTDFSVVSDECEFFTA